MENQTKCYACDEAEAKCQCIKEQCKDCKRPFKITKGEQEFYASRDLKLPKRCKPCRILLKRAKGEVILKHEINASHL